jgi:hypothetical protein
MAEENVAETAEPKTVRFYYLKSVHFRVIHADGAFGGVTPKGQLHFSVYSERHAIPKEIVYDIKENGTIGEERIADRVVRNGLVRELDADIVMDLPTAVSFRTWINTKVDSMVKEQAKEKTQEKENAK